MYNQLCLEIDPWLELSLRVWFQVVSKNMSGPCKLIRWVGFDTDFIPNKNDERFRLWENGPTMWWELLEGNKIKSFQEIKDKFEGMGNKDFFRFLQLRHYLDHDIKRENFSSESGIINCVVSAYQSKLNKKLISKLYRGLENLKNQDTQYIKQKWEAEANITLSLEEWEEINQHVWKTSSSLMWREYAWKNVVRFFRTPAQTKYRETICWRNCGEKVAHHVHVFWSCPTLHNYWRDLKECIDKVLGCDLPFTFELFYLGKYNVQNVGKVNIRMLRIMLLAGKKGITKMWMKADVPKVKNWIDVMYNIYNMEKLTYAMRLENEKFEEIWNGWLRFIKTI